MFRNTSQERRRIASRTGVQRGLRDPEILGKGSRACPLIEHEAIQDGVPVQRPYWNDEMDITNQSLEWPNFETLGYEDLMFATEPTNNSLIGPWNASIPYFFLGAPNDSRDLFSDSTNEAATSAILPATPSKTPHSNNGEVSKEHDTAPKNRDPSKHEPSRGNLLETFYRLSWPSQALGFTDQDLVNYYFNNVCAIYSCFDSNSNSFRTLVADAWTGSSTIYLTIQSMAVGHVSNYYPYMAPLGLAKRSQAYKALQHDLQLLRLGKRPIESVLLSLLLLGVSAAWHQASNLGLQYLFIARNLIKSQLQDSRSGRNRAAPQHQEFFQEALMYWEAFASYVDPVPIMPFPGLKAPELCAPASLGQRHPHPWTGIVPEVYFALAEIGRLLRRQRNVASVSDSGPDKAPSQGDEQWAAALEQFLHSIEIPEPDGVADYNDPKTPKIDLIRVAKAYRRIGILEIYGTFPTLFWDRLNKDPTMQVLESAPPSDHGGYVGEADSCMTAIAISTLNAIKPISISSGASRLLPMIVMVTACLLRFPDYTTSPDAVEADRHDEVGYARYFVEARMLDLSRRYPQRPLLQMIDIIKEVWQRLDDGSTRAHWIDVAHEKGWQTIMG